MNEIKKQQNISDHLANERTLLAWIRTSIGIMGFGFVVVKFSLFMKQLTIILGKQLIIPQKGYSTFVGITLVAAGAFTSILAYLKYKKTEKQINENDYYNSSSFILILISFIFIISVVLIIYLLGSI